MRIAEIYKSIQGEGLLTGCESVFVRTSGCNLRCWYCDTPYTSWQPEGEDLAVDEILERIADWDCRHVVITGGEPMLFAELIPLCAGCQEGGYHVTIETAGTLHLPLKCQLMSISPKLAGSAPSLEHQPQWHHRHERSRHQPDVIRALIQQYDYQFKFVVDQPADCSEVESYLDEFPEIDRARVMLMPQGTSDDELADKVAWLEPRCAELGLGYCPRRQIEWFGLTRGT